MTDPEADGLDAARQLGESYAALVGAGDWQVDVVPEAVEAGEPGASAVDDGRAPVADAPGSSAAAASGTTSTCQSPAPTRAA